MSLKILMITALNLALLAVIGCSSSDTGERPNFSRMTDEEIAEYNAGVPASQQVYCRESASTSSRISRRVCSQPGDRAEETIQAIQQIITTDANR